MELVISALKRQIKLEEAKLEKREMMLGTANQIVHSEPLPEASPEYIIQLKKAVHLLIWDNEALECLIECQKHHQGGHSEIGHRIKTVIEKATPDF
jgi:hypothetical protein